MEEKELTVFVPCGHMAACISCGQRQMLRDLTEFFSVCIALQSYSEALQSSPALCAARKLGSGLR